MGMCCGFRAGSPFVRAVFMAALAVFFHVGAFAQSYFWNDAVADSLYGRLAEDAGIDGAEAADYVEEIIDAYRKFLHSPLDLNRASRRELERAGFLGQYRIASLLDYRERFGDVLSLTELSNIPGFGEKYVAGIAGFVSLGNFVPAGYSSAYGGGWSHDIMSRVKYRAAGGERLPNPLDRMLKYKASSAAGLSFGIAAASSPGDRLFPPDRSSACP